LRRSASIRNNCGTGPKTKVPNYGSTKHPNYGCSAVKLRAENPVAGNGIFGCGDGAPKIATKNYANEAAETVGRIALIAPTAADVRDVMVEGESGILNTAPPWFRPTYEPSKRKVEWPNGAVATCFSAQEPDRLRGPQFELGILEEFAAWDNMQETWDMFQFGLRLGKQPRWLMATTPRPVKLLKEIMARDDVVVTRGSTFENAANLAPPFLEAIKRRYEGTRLGRQEMYAELLTDTPGALWQQSWLDRDRVKGLPGLAQSSLRPTRPSVRCKMPLIRMAG
jgi:phage terminase large subunit-like protein